MLDVNNEKLSSDRNSGNPDDRTEETKSKKSRKEEVVNDNQNEEAEIESVAEENAQAEKDDQEEIAVNEKPVEVEEELPVVNGETEEEKPLEVKEMEESSSVSPAGNVEETAVETPESKKETPGEAVAEKSVSVPDFDLSSMTLEDMVQLIGKLLSDFEIKDVRHQIESLKTGFQKKYKPFFKEQKEAFIKAGGEAEEFFLSSPVKQKFDELVNEYKIKRQQYYKDLESSQKENLELRRMLIDELKSLIDNAEASTMYKDFRNLQERWREVGQIPRAKYNDVWRTYHHHVERFYDLLHLNNDFRDLDFRHNLEEKTKLIEKAEELAEEKDVNHAFNELQILHRIWKEDIGPVARELREEVWHKFSEATKKIHKKRHEYQDQLDEKLKANVGLKLAVIEKIKEIDYRDNKSHKDWQNSIKKVEALRDEFFAIGRVPKSKNEEVWQLFREATRRFNAEKNKFYKGIKKEQSENMKKKMVLVEQAEELKDSDNWEEATEIFKNIQSEWKKIGHVPRRDSDRIWKRFKDACNHYFDRLHEKQHDLDKDQSDVIEKKKEFIDAVKSSLEEKKDLTVEYVEQLLEEWRALGTLPQKMRHLDAKFNKLVDSIYKKMDIDPEEASFLKFKSTVDTLMDQNSTRKLDGEQLFIRRKIDDITKEIKQLENNISFISNASEDNPLVKNVYKNIEEHKRSLDIWKRKIDYMKKLEY
jgi:hypothetical protein